MLSRCRQTIIVCHFRAPRFEPAHRKLGNFLDVAWSVQVAIHNAFDTRAKTERLARLAGALSVLSSSYKKINATRISCLTPGATCKIFITRVFNLKQKGRAMQYLITLLLAASFSAPAFAADTPMTDKERIDQLIQQNKMLLAQNTLLAEQCERPKTKEEAFAQCMQAARGEKGAMATESVGSNCRLLLK